MKNQIQTMLEQRARTYEAYAEAEKDKFTKGFFEGKAEQARQTIDAIDCTIAGDTQGAVDALNGDS